MPFSLREMRPESLWSMMAATAVKGRGLSAVRALARLSWKEMQNCAWPAATSASAPDSGGVLPRAKKNAARDHPRAANAVSYTGIIRQVPRVKAKRLLILSRPLASSPTCVFQLPLYYDSFPPFCQEEENIR